VDNNPHGYWILRIVPGQGARRGIILDVPFWPTRRPSTLVARTPSKGARRPGRVPQIREDRPQRLPPWLGHDDGWQQLRRLRRRPTQVRRRAPCSQSAVVKLFFAPHRRYGGMGESDSSSARALDRTAHSEIILQSASPHHACRKAATLCQCATSARPPSRAEGRASLRRLGPTTAMWC